MPQATPEEEAPMHATNPWASPVAFLSLSFLMCHGKKDWAYFSETPLIINFL